MQVIALTVCNNRMIGEKVVDDFPDRCPICDSELVKQIVNLKDMQANSIGFTVNLVKCVDPLCGLFNIVPMVEQMHNDVIQLSRAA